MSYPAANVKLMFDFRAPGQFPVDISPGSAAPDLGSVPLERLEAQLCEVAGHLAAATCRFLVLLAEFDERRGWGSWGLGSCAAWRSWRGPKSSGAPPRRVPAAPGPPGPPARPPACAAPPPCHAHGR